MNHATDQQGPKVGVRYGLSLTLGDHSARHLRRILRAYLRSWDMPELVDPATLALTELVANVVRHVRDRKAALLILRQPGGIRVEVTDTDPRPPQSPSSTAVDEPASAPTTELADGGRGLLILDAVTDRWGWHHLPDHSGKTVWFECDTKPTD